MGLDWMDGDRRWLADMAHNRARGDAVGHAGLSVQLEVLVLLAEAVQLDLQLLNAPPLGLQKLLLALDDVVEFQEVLDSPVRALGAALTSGIHG